MWQGAAMQFNWHFNERPPSPGITKQQSIVDIDSLNKRRLYAKVLSEPPLVTSGYTANGIAGGGGTGASGDAPASEGFTALLSNGDELLRLAEHCRVVIDNVVDAPSALLAAGNIHDAAIGWQKKISWFQVTGCLLSGEKRPGCAEEGGVFLSYTMLNPRLQSLRGIRHSAPRVAGAHAEDIETTNSLPNAFEVETSAHFIYIRSPFTFVRHPRV